jgi:penicillin amidase
VIVRKSLPQVSGEIELSGLEEPVEVARDIYGVPHISAASELDLYRALGFVNAQDRLWQLDIFRRLSQGRLAEIFGPILIPLDHRHRVIGFQRLAGKLYADAEESSKAICRAYVGGINQYVERFPDRLPIEFTLLRYRPERWSPEDVYGVLMWQQWMVTFNWESELAMVALLQSLGSDAVLELVDVAKVTGPTIIPESERQYAPSPSRIDGTVLPPEFDYGLIKFKDQEQVRPESDSSDTAWLSRGAEVFASNCWVVDGTRSRSGKPILSNDPHIPHTLPSIWYMVHLSAPGIDDAAGIMTLGVPMIVMGHTRHIAWGDTTTGADTQDLFIEKLNPDNPNEYLHDGEYRRFEIVKEIIHYREGGQMKAVEKEIRLSVHGPIINEIADPPVHPETPLALRWAGYESSDSIKSSSAALKARNWEEFRAALRDTITPVWNWVYADAKGNIGYQMVGYIPIRKKGRGMVPVPGWLEAYEWDGYVPYDEMPRLFNPSNGYIVTANNRVAPEDYPYLISTRFAPPYRAARIEHLLLQHEKLSAEDMTQIQLDVYSKRGERLRDFVVSACETYPKPGPDFARAVELLRRWDLNADAESPGAAIFYESHAMVARSIFGTRMGPDLWKRLYRSFGNLDDMVDDESAQKWFDNPETEVVETRDEAISAGVAEAVTSLREFFGTEPDDWQWGQLHTLTFRHPLGRSGALAKALNLGPFPLGGAISTVNPGVYYFDSGQKPYSVLSGPSMRTVIDFGDVDAARMVITLGQSEQRFSEHYADQLPHWLKGESLPMWKTDDSIESHLEGRLILRPARD